MKVLFVSRRGIFSAQGGEQVQVRATAAALRPLGVHADIAADIPQQYERYDLIHFFGLDHDHIDKIEHSPGVVKALTPVFWEQYQQFGRDWEQQPRSRMVRRIAKWRRNLRRRPERNARRCGLRQYLARENALPRSRSDYKWAAFQDVVGLIDFFLPNSEMEMGSVCRSFVFEEPPRYAVVHNAIDLHTIDEQSDFFGRKLRPQKFVLCSAGIDPRKNQYSLVRALADTGLPVILAGQVRDETYAHAVAAVARSSGTEVRLLGHLASPDLNSLYAHATAHVLPSYAETPGISNLEAIAHGCPNVSTQLGGLAEYVGRHSLYCNPYHVPHIREQVLAALEMPRNSDGAAYVREQFTWERSAKATLAAYEQALALGPPRH
jgi:glycosyltransferase involved in cell wall biosynthesis